MHAGTGSPILDTYATAVVIIKLKIIANPCEVIVEPNQKLRQYYSPFLAESYIYSRFKVQSVPYP